MSRTRALVVAVAVLAAASLALSSSVGTATTVTCSAGTVTARLKEQALPKPVVSMRARIYRAASECDYAALVRLADEHGKGLNLPFARSQGLYVWPSAFRLHPTEADWRAVRALYPQSVIDQMRTSGIGYFGYRVGIRPDGDWQLFVTGD